MTAVINQKPPLPAEIFYQGEALLTRSQEIGLDVYHWYPSAVIVTRCGALWSARNSIVLDMQGGPKLSEEDLQELFLGLPMSPEAKPDDRAFIRRKLIQARHPG